VILDMEKLTTWIKAERGRLARLASVCSITHSAIIQWKQVPSEHVLKVSEMTGIEPAILRPDLYHGMERVA
jgi:hypothetical protein